MVANGAMWEPGAGGDDRTEFAEAPFFTDREEAGRALAEQLEAYRGRGTVVLGIPRGGVPVAAEIARHLDAELEVIVARKLGAPFSSELAIGAVTADGGRYLNDEMIRTYEISDTYLGAVTDVQMKKAREYEARFRGGRPVPPLAGRVVILVDDGLATGATMRAAVNAARRRRPSRLIVAVPVGSSEACAAIRREADDLVCLHESGVFGAVGMYYRHFEPTEDEQVEALLKEAHAGAAFPA